MAAAVTLAGTITGSLACTPTTTALVDPEAAARPFAAPSARAGVTAPRWAPDVATSIPLWVDSVPDAPRMSPALVALTHDAARAWDTPGVPVHFTRAAAPESALVRVHWRWNLPSSGRDGPWSVGGVTRRVATERGEMLDVDMWIVLAPHRDGVMLAPEVLRAVLLHELGHALGLGHDHVACAIMAPMAGPRAITPRDRAALHARYAADARSTGERGRLHHEHARNASCNSVLSSDPTRRRRREHSSRRRCRLSGPSTSRLLPRLLGRPRLRGRSARVQFAGRALRPGSLDLR